MSQATDYAVANASGASVRADINSIFAAVASSNSGTAEPSTTYSFMIWVDTTNNVVKLRNGANDAWLTMPFSMTASNTVDINGGTVDGATIGASSASSIVGTTIVANTSLNIASDGATVTGIKDEDNMSSDSATKLATQQSIKAYVDSQVGTVDTLAEILANGNTTGGTDLAVSAADDITFTDSSKAIFGDGSDLQIYHDASDSYIKENGTGNLIIAADDFRVTNVAVSENMIGADTDGVVTLYHNGSSKLTTASGGIDVTGTVTADNEVTIGSASTDAAGVKFAVSGANRYIASSWDGIVSIGTGTTLTGGTQYLTISSDGNCGINTTSPTEKLTVNGALAITGALSDDRTSTGAMDFSSGVTRFVSYGASGTGGIFAFRTAEGGSSSSERMRIDSSGNVLVGATSSQGGGKIQIQDSTAGDSILRLDYYPSGTPAITSGDVLGKIYFSGVDNGLNSGDANRVGAIIQGVADANWAWTSGVTDSAPTALTFHTHPASDLGSSLAPERMRIDSSGNVGINTDSPDNKLHVYKGDSGHSWSFDGDDILIVENSDSLSLNIATPNSNSANILFSDADARGQGRILYDHSGDYMAFMTAGISSERMRIDSAGDVKVGTSNDYSTKFLSYTTDTADRVIQGEANSTYTGSILGLGCTRNTTDDSYNFIYAERRGYASTFIVRDNGDCENSNGTYGSISDERLKHSIVDATSQWDDIKALKIRNFKLKADGDDAKTQIGLIAQEVEEISPNLIKEVKSDEYHVAIDSDFETEKVKVMKYSILYTKAVKALQEAMDRIETLEVKVEALEG